MIEVNGSVYITATEAPEHLGTDCSPQTVRQWGKRRKVNGYRLGRETYYSLDELTEVEYVTRTSPTGRPRAAA